MSQLPACPTGGATPPGIFLLLSACTYQQEIGSVGRMGRRMAEGEGSVASSHWGRLSPSMPPSHHYRGSNKECLHWDIFTRLSLLPLLEGCLPLRGRLAPPACQVRGGQPACLGSFLSGHAFLLHATASPSHQREAAITATTPRLGSPSRPTATPLERRGGQSWAFAQMGLGPPASLLWG